MFGRGLRMGSGTLLVVSSVGLIGLIVVRSGIRGGTDGRVTALGGGGRNRRARGQPASRRREERSWPVKRNQRNEGAPHRGLSGGSGRLRVGRLSPDSSPLRPGPHRRSHLAVRLEPVGGPYVILATEGGGVPQGY